MGNLVAALSGWMKSAAGVLQRRRFDAQVRRAKRMRDESSALRIGLTGSSGKSSTAGLLSHILRAQGRVAEQADSNLFGTLVRTLRKQAGTNDFVVAELGVAGVGQMQPMAEMLKPDVAIVTLVALEHYSHFRTHEAVAEEKGWLVEKLAPGGFAVLNRDDPHVMRMAGRTAERVVTFGREAGADYHVANVGAAFPERLRLDLTWSGGTLALQSNFVAEHFWVTVAAAAAASLEIGVPPATVAERVASFEPVRHRCGVISVPNGPHFIVDTVKAPWHSVMLAFDIAAKATVARKRILLGQMSDFPGANTKYRDAYRAASVAANQVMFVGDHSHRSKASQEDRDQGRFMAFTTPREAAEHIRNTAEPGELILLKGSSNLHLERVAMSFVDDVQCWIPSCGRKEGCYACGLYRVPYERHKGRKSWRRRERLARLISPFRVFSRRGRGQESGTPSNPDP